jgi:hypothetical protein
MNEIDDVIYRITKQKQWLDIEFNSRKISTTIKPLRYFVLCAMAVKALDITINILNKANDQYKSIIS